MKINKRKLTIHIIIGMVAGMVLGTIINLTGNDGWISESLVNGLFDAVGQIFLRLLTVLVVPLVFISLVCGAAALDDIRKVGRVGLMTMGLYIL
jgi:Na+/H+-dicarboxylate symporter